MTSDDLASHRATLENYIRYPGILACIPAIAIAIGYQNILMSMSMCLFGMICFVSSCMYLKAGADLQKLKDKEEKILLVSDIQKDMWGEIQELFERENFVSMIRDGSNSHRILELINLVNSDKFMNSDLAVIDIKIKNIRRYHAQQGSLKDYEGRKYA